jgi:ADP-heptose:LPS heptosyltransferase
MSMTPKYVRGGIGDMLLAAESAISEGVVDVFSHYDKAPDVYETLGVKINRFEYFDSYKALHSVFFPGSPLPPTKYPKVAWPTPCIHRLKQEKIVGIHVEGSAYSNKVWAARGQPTKDMGLEFLQNLFKEIDKLDVGVYLFCSPSRNTEISRIFMDNADNEFYTIAFPNVWESLSCVSHCNSVIASDSCIKTMAAIQQIPSIVLVADYADPFRDETFLNPYVQDGIMQVVKYRDTKDLSAREILSQLP